MTQNIVRALFFQKIIQMAEMGFLRREYEKQNENKCENIYIMV